MPTAAHHHPRRERQAARVDGLVGSRGSRHTARPPRSPRSMARARGWFAALRAGSPSPTAERRSRELRIDEHDAGGRRQRADQTSRLTCPDINPSAFTAREWRPRSSGGASGQDTVAATAPTVDGQTAGTGTGGSIRLTPATAIAASLNPASTGPVAESLQALSTTAATIENAPAGTGQGEWDFAADSGATKSLAVVIPGDASAGNYSSTLTFTTAPAVAG